MRVSKVIFPRNLRASFARAAKKAFPSETFAICLGTKGSREISIEQLYYPDSASITMDPDGKGFEIADKVYALAEMFGRASGLSVVADVHSHPFLDGSTIDASPSETDWDYCQTKAPVHGVCAVTEHNGRKYARYRFWPRAASIEVSL